MSTHGGAIPSSRALLVRLVFIPGAAGRVLYGELQAAFAIGMRGLAAPAPMLGTLRLRA